jgi:transcriptional regulator with XRE-family HTH domain
MNTAATFTVSNSAPPEVGATLQRMRLARGLTLEDLSRIAGVSKSMLSQIEREKANPTIAITWRLANALGVQIGELLSSEVRSAELIRVVDAHEIPTLPGSHAGYSLRILGPGHQRAPDRIDRRGGTRSGHREEENQARRHGALSGRPGPRDPQRRQDRGARAAGGGTALMHLSDESVEFVKNTWKQRDG